MLSLMNMAAANSKTECVMMVGPDMTMDLIGDTLTNPANPLPLKCAHCTFPDLDFVAQPYFLAKGFASPTETSSAEVGNFLVRDRVKTILEMAVPNACKFYKAEDRKGKVKLEWWLAVPTTLIATPMPKAYKRCSKCGEAKSMDEGMKQSWDAMLGFDSKGVDVFKSRGWHTFDCVEDSYDNFKKGYPGEEFPWKNWRVKPPTHPERWTRLMIARDLYFSVRLEQLLKRANVRGQLIRSVQFENAKLSAQDEEWIREKLGLLAKLGLVERDPTIKGWSSEKDARALKAWFKDYLKTNTKGKVKEFDFGAIKKRERIELPKAYRAFIRSVGTKSFRDVMEMVGFKATVLAPSDLDFKNYRRGKVEFLDEDDAEIDGVMFATTDHGDAFVFDVSSKADGGDFPVYRHDHENNVMEPFAPNFASCVKRFVEKN
jgi:hypothetical protein